MAIEKFNSRKPIAAITKIVGDSRMLTVKEANELIDGINGTVETIEEEISNIPIETPDLQSVTDEGATTTNPITIGTVTDGTAVQSVGVRGVAAGVSTWGADNATGDSQFNTVSNSDGVIKPYKSYVALLNQTGTNAPIATVLENTLGITLTWGYDSVGSYSTTNAIFSESTTTVYTGQNYGGSEAITYAYTFDDINIAIETNTLLGVAQNGNLINTMIEIRVYS